MHQSLTGAQRQLRIADGFEFVRWKACKDLVEILAVAGIDGASTIEQFVKNDFRRGEF